MPPTRAIRRAACSRSARPAGGVGTTTIFGHTFVTTGWLGWTDDGMGERRARTRFRRAITIPGYQDLAGGRRWHLFFAWIARALLARVADLERDQGKLARDGAARRRSSESSGRCKRYYLKLAQRAAAARHVQSAAESSVHGRACSSSRRWSCSTGLALSPGIDAIANPLTVAVRRTSVRAPLAFRRNGAARWASSRIHMFQVATQGDRQSDALDDHRLVSAANETTSLFLASTAVGAGRMRTDRLRHSSEQSSSVQRILASVEGLNHAADRNARPGARIPRSATSTATSGSTVLPTPSDTQYAGARSAQFRAVPVDRRRRGRTRRKPSTLAQPAAMPRQHANHAPRLRRRLERDRQMDRRAARDGSRRSALPRPDARYVVFRCMDNDGSGNLYYESLDLHQARHPQALLALRLNDVPLDPDHGAPVRLRVPTQLGYKSAKWVARIELVGSFRHHWWRTWRLLGRSGIRMVRGDLRRACIAACAIVLALTAVSPAEPVPYPATGKDSLDKLLGDVVGWKLTPSISLAIVENGKIVYAGARGSADLEKNLPATVELCTQLARSERSSWPPPCFSSPQKANFISTIP